MKKVENLVFNNNDLAGLWTIDGHEVRRVFGEKKYWQGVDEIIRLYSELHPHEMTVTKVDNEIDRNSASNEFASNKSGSARKALSLPSRLLLVLKDYDPEIIKNKKKRTAFMKRYPFLRACQTV